MGGITQKSAQASLYSITPTTSGSLIDITVPPWANKITLSFDSVTTTGTSNLNLRIGDSVGVYATGYLSASGGAIPSGAGNSVVNITAFRIGGNQSSAANWVGEIVLTRLNNSGTAWACAGTLASANGVYSTGGTKSSPPMAGLLQTIRLSTDLGVDTFAAGQITMYVEG